MGSRVSCFIRRYGPAAAGALLPLLLLLVWMFWPGNSFRAEPQDPPRTVVYSLVPPTDVAAFVERSRREQLLGRQLFLNNVEVHGDPQSGFFMVGTAEGDQLPVSWDVPKDEAAIPGEGERVDLAGEIWPMPTLSWARRHWKLDRETAARLKETPVQLRALKVTRAKE